MGYALVRSGVTPGQGLVGPGEYALVEAGDQGTPALDIELMMVLSTYDSAISQPVAPFILLKRYDSMTMTNGQPSEKLNSRSPAFAGNTNTLAGSAAGGTAYLAALHAATNNAAGLFVKGRWRPPRTWLRPSVDSGQLFSGGNPFGLGTGNDTCQPLCDVDMKFDYKAPVAIQRLIRRPTFREGWTYYSQQIKGATYAVQGGTRVEQANWIARCPYSINIRQQQTPNYPLLNSGPTLTNIQLDAAMSAGLAMQKKGFKTLGATSAESAAMQKMLPKTLAVSLADTPAMYRTLFKTLAASDVNTLAMVKQRLLSLPASVTLAAAMKRLQPRSLAASLTATPALTRGLYRLLAGASTILATLSRRTNVSLQGSTTLAPAVQRKRFFTLAYVMFNAEAFPFRRAVIRRLDAVTTATPSMTLRNARTFAASMTAGLAMRRMQPRTLAVTSVEQPSLIRRLFQALASSVVLSPVVQKAFVKTLPASTTLTPTLTIKKVLNITLPASAPVTAAMTRRKTLYQSLAVSAVLAPSVTFLPKRYQTLNATMAASLVVKRRMFKQLDALATFQAAQVLFTKHAIRLDASSVVQVALQRRQLYFKRLDAGMVAAPALSRLPTFYLRAALIDTVDIGIVHLFVLRLIALFEAGLDVAIIGGETWLPSVRTGEAELTERPGELEGPQTGHTQRGRAGHNARGVRGRKWL